MTLGTGTRGAEARSHRPRTRRRSVPAAGLPLRDGVDARSLLKGQHSGPIGALQDALPRRCPSSARSSPAARTPSRAAGCRCSRTWPRRYGVYILGSNNQSPFRESVDPAEIDVVPRPRPAAAEVGVRGHRTRGLQRGLPVGAPPGARARGRGRCATWCSRTRRCRSPTSRLIAPGRERAQHRPRRGREPAAVPRCPARGARIGFATSLPAFIYGDLPAGVDPCSDTSKYYMRCLDKPRHEPRDAGRGQPGPLGHRARRSGSRSTGCAPPGARSPIPRCDFDYNVTPHLVGQLGDLVFDGQTAITQRGLRGREAATTWATRASCRPAGERRRLAGALRRAQARVPGAGPLGRPGRPARRRCGRRRPSSPRAPATGSRTTTWRRRSRPTCRSRPTPGGATASRRRRRGWHVARTASRSPAGAQTAATDCRRASAPTRASAPPSRRPPRARAARASVRPASRPASTCSPSRCTWVSIATVSPSAFSKCVGIPGGHARSGGGS